MYLRYPLVLFSLIVMLSGCTASGEFDAGKALGVGVGALQVAMLDEGTVKQAASLSAKEMDVQNQVAGPDNLYSKRLLRMTEKLGRYDGLNLNFKVYLSEDINAFAMADGTVRVYSGLMDVMPDDQVLAVICHEIGHVKLQHSYYQMKEALLTNVAFDAVSTMGGTVGDLTSSQLGKLAQSAVHARFSQKDELEADAYAVWTLHKMGDDPYAMKRSIETLQQGGGSGGSFLSSHPSNRQRIDQIQSVINRL